MAQGFVRALRNTADLMADGMAPRERTITTAVSASARLVPTAVAAALHLPGRFDGQQLAGSGALVWEGEMLERPARLVH